MLLKMHRNERVITTIDFVELRPNAVHIAEARCRDCQEILQDSSKRNEDEALTRVRRDLRWHTTMFHFP